MGGASAGVRLSDRFDNVAALLGAEFSGAPFKFEDGSTSDIELTEEVGAPAGASDETLARANFGAKAHKFCVFKIVHQRPSLLKRVRGVASRGFSTSHIAVSVHQVTDINFRTQEVIVNPVADTGADHGMLQSLTVINESLFSASLFAFKEDRDIVNGGRPT